MISTHTGTIPIAGLPPAARQAQMFPTLKTGSLVSIGQICGSGCIATLNRQTVKIHHNNKLVVQGPCTANGLWTVPVQEVPAPVPVTQSVPPIANLAMSALVVKTVQDRVAFLHVATGYPLVFTWLHAIHNGLFATWPGLSVSIFKKHLPKSQITAIGHLDQQRKDTKSTKPKITNLPSTNFDNNETASPSTKPLVLLRTHCIYATCEPISRKIFSDLPGRFPIQSTRGMNYLLVFYDYSSNAILCKPMKDKTSPDIVTSQGNTASTPVTRP